MSRIGLAALATVVASVGAAPAIAAKGRITIPYITGRPGTQNFAGHPGWVEVYCPKGKTYAARVAQDGTFEVDDAAKGGTLTVTFDKFEVIPFVVPDYAAQGNYDVAIPVEYACVPPGYPEVWDREYLRKDYHHWLQSFVPGCTQIYGITIFDGPKAVSWGNKFNATLYQDGPDGKPIIIRGCMGCGDLEGKHIDFLSGGHSDHDCPRVGWRHGDLEVTPGKTYAMCAGGYNSHGGQQLLLPVYIRPDNGDGYPAGQAFAEAGHSRKISPTGGDLCCLIFGNGHGQQVENQVRTEEWEIFIPSLPPSRHWGQSFTSHGKGLAGLSFYASNGSQQPLTCEVNIRKDFPGGDLAVHGGKPKAALAHDSPVRPIIRYPDWPKPTPGTDHYWKLPADLFQVAYAPGEIPLEPGKGYYVELTFSEPVVMYADGDAYGEGFAHYEDLKMEHVRQNGTKHSVRWTLLVNIVTYGDAPVRR